MAKNSIFDPTKDGVKADNSGYSSNQIDKMIGESAAALIDDDASGDDTVYSSAKIYSLLPEDTATGSEVTITDACPDLPVVDYSLKIEAEQEGTGTPSISNTRLFIPRESINLYHSGADTSDPVTYEIELDDQIYFGEIDSEGNGTITHGLYVADQVSNVFLHTNGVYYWTLGQNVSSITGPNVISSNFVSGSGVTIGYCYVTGGQGQTIVAVPSDQSLNTKELASAWCAENLPQFIYKLATPISFTVSDMPALKTLSGTTNNFWCDTGDISVTYKKLTTLS